MSGCLLTSDAGGREVLTVNVNQINQDLIRQVNTVLSQHTSDMGGGGAGTQPSSSSSAAAATPLLNNTTSYGGPTAASSGGGPSNHQSGIVSSSHLFGGHVSQGSIGPTPPSAGCSNSVGLAPISMPSLSSRRYEAIHTKYSSLSSKLVNLF